MEAFLEKLESANTSGKKAFAFDTRRRHLLAGSAGKEIEKRLRRLRMSIVKPYASALIFEEEKVTKQESESKEEWKERWHRSARLQEGMEEMFEQIGVEIAESIQ
jgi:hypothetical protein